ncbi:MAG: protease complex subunit PrcB family protein [Thermodesulfobacteriota bacterium]
MWSILLVMIVAVISIGQGCFVLSGSTEKTGELKIKKDWKGYQSGHTKPAKLVIRTEDEWERVWAQVGGPQIPKPELPEVNFETEIVIAVFMGERQTGGYGIEIRRVVRRQEEIIVHVEERHPRPDSLVTMALTQPYHIAVIPNFHLPVRFITKNDESVKSKIYRRGRGERRDNILNSVQFSLRTLRALRWKWPFLTFYEFININGKQLSIAPCACRKYI